MRLVLGELERLKRFGGDTRKLEAAQEQLNLLVRSLGGEKTLPYTMRAAHWDPKFEDADFVLDEAQTELDQAITQAFGH